VHGTDHSLRHTRSPITLLVLGLLAVSGVAALVALGLWQLERRAWKLDLMHRVDQRIHARPVAAPAPSAWASIDAESAEYRRVAMTGIFLNDRETLVRAVTVMGRGFWVVTPFKTHEGFIVLVNRGFVPPEQRKIAARSAGQIKGATTVGGLLRLTEPKGGFLHTNDPSQDRWYSRDVSAIARERGLTQNVAPYFIDADAVAGSGARPIGGLTVVAFSNNHLQYAITWFVLALMLTAGAALTVRHEIRARKGLLTAYDDVSPRSPQPSASGRS